jgi:hypothetical protein
MEAGAAIEERQEDAMLRLVIAIVALIALQAPLSAKGVPVVARAASVDRPSLTKPIPIRSVSYSRMAQQR